MTVKLLLLRLGVTTSAMLKLIGELQCTEEELKQWNRNGHSSLDNMISRTRLGDVQSMVECKQQANNFFELRQKELHMLLIVRQTCGIKSHALIDWLKYGNQQYKLFTVEGFRRRNKIKAVMEGNSLVTYMEDIFRASTDYFVNLLGSTIGTGALPYSMREGPRSTMVRIVG